MESRKARMVCIWQIRSSVKRGNSAFLQRCLYTALTFQIPSNLLCSWLAPLHCHASSERIGIVCHFCGLQGKPNRKKIKNLRKRVRKTLADRWRQGACNKNRRESRKERARRVGDNLRFLFLSPSLSLPLPPSLPVSDPPTPHTHFMSGLRRLSWIFATL